MDEEVHKLRHYITDRGHDIKVQKEKMKYFESTIIEKSIMISKCQAEIEELKAFRFTNESLKK